MAQPIANPLRRSGTLFLLLGIFVLASLAGYLVVRNAVTNTVEHQALAIAEIVASQASTARSVYASEVAEKLRRDGFGPHVNSADMPGHVPIPAQFLKLVGRASSAVADKLYEYRPVSRWNLEPTQGLSDDFLRWAWPQLERQDSASPANAIGWKPVYRFEEVGGQRVLRYLAADPASLPSCVQCHNSYEKMPETLALRVSQGTPGHKEWKLHQLLGAISISIPLDKAEMLAGMQIRQTSFFVFGILVASFLSLMWFNWRLSKEELSHFNARAELQRSELVARTANELLQAKLGVERALEELSTYLRAIDQHAIVSVTDRAGVIVQVNDKFVEVSGYRREELLGQDHRIINSQRHPPAFFAHLWATLARGEIWRGTICNRAKSGRHYWVDSAIVPMRDTSGEIVRYVSIRIDITDRVRAQEDILRLATHDALTGLANRTLLLERMRATVGAERRQADPAAVLFIDLDQFKEVNDSLGHDIGDSLLIEVARRFATCVRTQDTVARQGGDEFIVFLPEVQGAAGAQALAEIMLSALAEPFRVRDMDLHVGASIGVALFPQDGASAEELLKNADVAMYRAKASGRNRFMCFTPDMIDMATDRFALIDDLRRSIRLGELALVYQPIVGVASGALEAVEVLVRWPHPQRGMLMPQQFIGLAESSGLIMALGDLVLRAACAQWVDWQRRGLNPPKIAVNLSAIQFHDRTLVQRVETILQDTGMDPRRLELEITETCLMLQIEDVSGTLGALGAMGIGVAIDDFGTGYSSLSYLKRFAIDTLKIDQSFIRDIEQDADDAAIVTTIIAMGHSLGMQVIAEGVERESQLAYLRTCGCNQYQGYLFARPLAAQAFERQCLGASPGV